MTQNETELPYVDTRNPKNVIVRALKEKISAYGLVGAPIDIVKEYPSKESFKNNKDGTFEPRRKIVVKKSRNRINNQGIGREYGSSFFDRENLDLKFKLGWEDTYDIQISVWSPDSDDRDNLVELIKLWMLEFEQSELPEGGFYFLKHGIHEINFLGASDSINTSIYMNGPMYIGLLDYNLLAEFSGTTIHGFERYNFLIRSVLANDLSVPEVPQYKSDPLIIKVGESISTTGCIDCDNGEI